MVRAARTGAAAPAPGPGATPVESWDLSRAGQIGREQLEAITSVHEGFARNLTHALGAYLRVGFQATLVSAEHLTYREFLQSVPEITYLASCRLIPMEVNAVVQMDLKIAFPMIDVLLGGEGAGLAEPREITEIEEQILDGVARVVCRELETAWRALKMQIAFERRVETSAARRLMAPEDRTLSLSFEITMSEVRGSLSVAVPVTVSHALLRQLAVDWTRVPGSQSGDSRRRLMHLLLDCPFVAEVASTGLRAGMGALAGMIPGQRLGFDRGAAEPASFLVAGVGLARALPARCGNRRAARLLESPQALAAATED